MRRRANAISAYLPFGRQAEGRQAEDTGIKPELWWDVVPRALRAEDVIAIVTRIPRGRGALVVVLDNASIHVSRVLKRARRRLGRKGIYLYHLPPTAPS